MQAAHSRPGSIYAPMTTELPVEQTSKEAWRPTCAHGSSAAAAASKWKHPDNHPIEPRNSGPDLKTLRA